MDKRKWTQLLSTLICNIHLKNFFTGTIHQGKTKGICVPGLNCYSCPGAAGACPIGSFQATIISHAGFFPFYTLGILIFFGTLFGRMICSFLCPMGFFQELLYKIPSKKIKKNDLTRKLSLLKYAILLIFVIILPVLFFLISGVPTPAFCKWICPAGTLEGGIPLMIADKSLRDLAGWLFDWKLLLALLFITASIKIYRPFCRFLCPLGAFYSFFNKHSLFGIEVDAEKCTLCGACTSSCLLDVKEINDRECIRCGECIKRCNQDAISFSKIKIKNRGEKK